jgi:hypothetical protein
MHSDGFPQSMQQGDILSHNLTLWRVLVVTRTATLFVVWLGQSMCHAHITVIAVDLKHSSVVPLKKMFKIVNGVQQTCLS